MAIDNDPQAQAFAEYIRDKKILVVDPDPLARPTWLKTWTALGAKPEQLTTAAGLRDSLQEMARLKPELVLAEYDLGKTSGMELFQKARKTLPYSEQSIFALLLSNPSQSAIAKSLEEDVDLSITKPANPALIRAQIMKAVIGKKHPSEYQQTLSEGKQALADQRPEDAIRLFEKAQAQDPAPTLAWYYLGKTHGLSKKWKEAEAAFQKGLALNKIHYKCLAGLEDALMKQNRIAEAYELSKRVSQYFPPTSDRLSIAIKAALVIQAYEEIERYFQQFIKLEDRSPETTRYLCAALLVCGKYYLKNNSRSRALDLFRRSVLLAANNSRVVDEIVSVLTAAGMDKEAREFPVLVATAVKK